MLHFVVLGGLLFLADHLLMGQADDPHTIVVDAAVDQEAITTFKNSRGRDPNAEELAALRRVWLDNEVLYREGVAMQLDKGDTAIRDRVIFKALSMVDANTRLPRHDDKVLREWFEQHRDKYDEPTRYDFQEAVLSGDSSETAVRSFVKELNSRTTGEANAGLRVFKGRPQKNLVLSYGEAFPKALDSLPRGRWSAIETKEGWRAIQPDSVTAGKPADFDVVAPAVLQDWTDATLAEQRSAAVQELTRKYTVKFSTGAR